MKITEVEVHQTNLRYQDYNAKMISRYHGRTFLDRRVFVVRTDNGIEGIGEGSSPDTEERLREKYVGTSPYDWLGDETDLAMNMATYDLMGKHAGVPAWKLMGPQVRSWAPVSFWTVSQPPEGMAVEVRRAAELGYHWMKYHTDEIQNVVEQTKAMQEAAPPGFKVHYDFNANSNVHNIAPVLKELEKFPIAGRFEDVLPYSDEDGYRLLREQSRLPVIVHHGLPMSMIKGMCDGYMSGHAPVGKALKTAVLGETLNIPVMFQNGGGVINQAFVAHQAAVARMATIDHVTLCHLFKDDVTNETMPVIGGSVEVPKAPGLGVTLDLDKLDACKQRKPQEYEPFLVSLCYEEGLTVHVRHNAHIPSHGDNLRFHERLLRAGAPGHVPTYALPLHTEYWDASDDAAEFERIWPQTEDSPFWEKK
jgi:L-alanine-DL-glutamate epimerase-like enolase superfamily enzyme